MSFLAFKISDYDHTAEREQYRAVCRLLKAKFEQSEEPCLFLANYNIYDCELDGIIMKSDAIIGVEFKNYGGELQAVENGNWKLADGTVIKGGSGKSVYQQARVNHVALKKGLKESGAIPARMLKHIPALVVFARPISLDNRLSDKVKSWLHICDIEHFIEKVEDITAPQFHLSTTQILDILPRLGLTDEFLDVRFSSDISISNKPVTVHAMEQIEPLTLKPEPLTPTLPASQSTERDYLKKVCESFITNDVLPALDLADRCRINVVHFSDFEQVMGLPLPFRSEYVAILQAANISSLVPRLQCIFNKRVTALSSDAICWGEGDFDTFTPAAQLPINANNGNHLPSASPMIDRSYAPDEVITMPTWLDDYIYNELDAKFQPAFDRFDFNLDLDRDESRVYLGTYFPRSFAESNMIFNAVLSEDSFLSLLKSKKEIKILDFGSGSGGELFGMLEAIDSHFINGLSLRIWAIDGNQHSLLILQRLMSHYNNHGKSRAQLEIIPASIHSEADLKCLSEYVSADYDIIIASKSLGEFQRKNFAGSNAYETFANLFAPMLSETGLFIITDVTIKDEATGWFLPQLMNVGINTFLSKHLSEFKSLVPCTQTQAYTECKKRCFHRHDAWVSHSAKQRDHSKFTVRILSRQGLSVDTTLLRQTFHNSECIYN